MRSLLAKGAARSLALGLIISPASGRELFTRVARRRHKAVIGSPEAVLTLRSHDILKAEAASSSALRDDIARRREPSHRLAREYLRIRSCHRVRAELSPSSNKLPRW